MFSPVSLALSIDLLVMAYIHLLKGLEATQGKHAAT
jgi:hypothetical protein